MHFCHHSWAYKWAEFNIKIGAASDILINFAVFYESEVRETVKKMYNSNVKFSVVVGKGIMLECLHYKTFPESLI